METQGSVSKKTDEPGNPSPPRALSRRQLLRTGGMAATAFTIVPRHVLGGPGFVAPSEKVTLACIGFGTQAIREIGGILASPDVQVVAVCDVEKDGTHYLEWGKGQIRDTIRRLLRRTRSGGKASTTCPAAARSARRSWRPTTPSSAARSSYKGCATYADFRELLDKEKDVTAVKVMTPDHTHAAISIAALKKGKNVMVHKPLANRVLEARTVIETARSKKIATHFLPASEGASQKAGAGHGQERRHRHAPGDPQLVDAARCGPSSRPCRPTRPPIPQGFRLDPLARPVAWTVPITPTTRTPISAAGTSSAAGRSPTWAITASGRSSSCSTWMPRSASNRRPATSARSPTRSATGSRTTTRSRPPARSGCGSPPRATGRRWTSSGTTAASSRPCPTNSWPTNKDLPEEGMLFVGDKGKILGGFRGENPRLIPEAQNGRLPRRRTHLPEPAPRQRGADSGQRSIRTQCRLDHRLQGGPGELRRFPAGRPDHRCLQPRRHLAPAWWPQAALGFRRREDHERPRGEPVPDAGIPPGLGNLSGVPPHVRTIQRRLRLPWRRISGFGAGAAGFLVANAGGAEREPAGPADWKPGLAAAGDAQGLPRVRQEDGRISA